MSFSVTIKSYMYLHFLSQFFISIEKFYLVEIQKKENFVFFFRRFRNCENM